MRFLLAISLWVLAFAFARADGSLYATQSALSEGKWVKISVSETGFYKLTFADLKKMGFSNPEKVSVHGYGGWPMEENFAIVKYMDDVPPVEVWRGNDYILFYGKGSVKWTANIDRKTFTHENNAYSTLGYYFVTDATETNDMLSVSWEGNADVELATYDDYMLYESDKYSITNAGRPNTGRELYGESFDTRTSQTFKFSTPGITDEAAKIAFRFVANLKSNPCIVRLSANGTPLTFSDSIIYVNTSENSPYIAAYAISPEVVWAGAKNETTNVNISFSMPQQTSHLDYIRLMMQRQLQPYETCTFFRSFASIDNHSRFIIKNASGNIRVFDVTEGRPVQQIETSLSGSELSFTIPADAKLREFAMVDLSKNIATPEVVGEVKPQNLHGLSQTDLVILAPDLFVAEAERLAAFRQTNDHLTVTIVTPEQVYNEFSSGVPEATAVRRFMKMFYDRRTSDADAPKYLLLFGDGRFDNRKLTDVWKNSSDNYIITYQSKETLNEYSYVTDDYFGFLRDGEGVNPVSATMCIGVGRFPVSTLTQAKNAVDKVIAYTKESKPGAWKNKICLVADDGNSGDKYRIDHMYQANSLAVYMENNHPAYITKKLYFDAFKRSMAGGKPTYPDIQTNIQKELKEGVLIINYTGHGDAVSWAEERVMTQTDIINATYPNLPLWIIAACDFAPFDQPASSAGEDVFLNKKSGGIAVFSTSRVAWSEPNARMNSQFMKYLFEKNNGRHQTLGEVMKNAKNDCKLIDLMSFVLLGDPSMTLTYPDEYKLDITEINGKTITDEPINIRAFEKINIKGNVNTSDGASNDRFAGMLSVTVFDSQEYITTLNNSGTLTDEGDPNTFSYFDYPNIMYIGNDSVRNGAFGFSFTVPKDISYSYQNGKISLYAVDEINRMEANGVYKNFTVGGTADIILPDETGPEIRALYLNRPDFRDGDRVNTTPLLTAIVWDESGINVGGSSIGHDIMLTIDNNPVLTYSLNSYYSTYLAGAECEAIVKFPMPALESGRHTAEFKVWDIHNNSNTRTLSFVVADNYRPVIVDLIAGPLPATDYVNFMISHDLPETNVDVEIQVFDLAGKLQWQYRESGSSSLFDSYRIHWDLTNGAGARLPSGIYVYRVIISSNQSQEVSKAKKLIILAQ
jgi:hypothetical protein